MNDTNTLAIENASVSYMNGRNCVIAFILYQDSTGWHLRWYLLN
jgi:hypothetical protein